MGDLIVPNTLAVWDPLGSMAAPQPLMTGHDGIGIHTMAGSFAGTDSLFHANGWTGTESHFGIAGSGFAKQWAPWNRRADAMLDGNLRWISIENADIGEMFPPASTASDESPPFTTAQVDRLVALCTYLCRVETHRLCPTTWACHTQGIPAVFVTSSCARGIAGHRAGIDPWRPATCPHWSLATGKICPRSVRLRQVRDVIVPRVAAALKPAPTPPAPIPTTPTGDKMIYLVQATGHPEQYLTDWITKRHVLAEDINVARFISVQAGHEISTQVVAGKPSGKPWILGADQADVLDRIPTVS